MSVQTTASSPLAARTPSRAPHSSTTPSTRHTLSGTVIKGMQSVVTPGRMRDPSPTSKARSPSPNYFGYQSGPSHLPISTYNGQHHTRSNWSPPSSTVRSTAAASPSAVPLDQNPEFAAFRRQSEGMGRVFSLHNSGAGVAPIDTSRGKETANKDASLPFGADGKLRSPVSKSGAALEPEGFNFGRSPKRHLSSDSTNFPAPVRKASPATNDPPESLFSKTGLSASPLETSNPPLFALKPPYFSIGKSRAETVPLPGAAPSSTDQSLVTPQHVVNLMQANTDEILILDLRVSTQYSKSRIAGALNLCIPTTLMKRPSFNVTKLAETFKSNEQRSRFESWRSSKYIVVYDAAASQVKDAAICINTIKKFESEGYDGITYIIKGGFADFAKRFPSLVDKTGPGSTNKATQPGTDEPLPVIGGCPMPATKSAANPFFGNIRQNMDLIGGVGQIAVKKPSQMSPGTWQNVPNWLRGATEEANNGKEVSDKFLHIEKREQKRMQEALSGEVSYGTPSAETPSSVKIAGIEKGSKNRYNNIWPFEHSRVKLEDVPNEGCDYVNANHIQSPLSNKRYIATQGPIPATFPDFWNMIWQQDVRVIVMLTAEREGNQVKAHNYWSDRSYGPFHLEKLSERKATVDPSKIYRHRRQANERRSSSDIKPAIVRADSKREDSQNEPHITVRKLTLSHENFPFEPIREITQLQYSSWPDFGAPAHPAHLLGLVEQCDAVVRAATNVKHTDPDPPESRKVLVHCSAGCGRTGTFCTVDSVIDMLKRQRNARKRKREGTPMDLDRSSMDMPSAKKPALGTKGDNPFFSTPADTTARKVEVEVKKEEEEWDLDGEWLQKDDTDLIEKTVEHFRHQRLSMVQSLRQFVLCYESVLEWLAEDAVREQEV